MRNRKAVRIAESGQPETLKRSEMKRILLTFLLGVVLGGAVMATYFIGRSRMTEVARERDQLRIQVATDNARVTELSAELANTKASRQKLESDNLELVARVREISKQPDNTLGMSHAGDKVPQPPSGGGQGAETESVDAGLRLIGQATTELQVEGRLLKLKQRCQLTLAQEASAREILTRQFDLAKRTGDPKADLFALLTPEQQAEFREMQQEERQLRNSGRVLTSAEGELSNLRSTFGLSQEQLDQAWPVLYEYARGQNEDEYLRKSKKGDPAALSVLEEMTTRKLERLKGVLSEEQFVIYEKYQQKHMAAWKLMFMTSP